jgi:hypothetical protein
VLNLLCLCSFYLLTFGGLYRFGDMSFNLLFYNIKKEHIIRNKKFRVKLKYGIDVGSNNDDYEYLLLVK